MTKGNSVSKVPLGSTTASESEVPVEVGQWYWVKATFGESSGRASPEDRARGAWLGCVMKVGSNYIHLESVSIDGMRYSRRVHMDEFWTKLEAEPNADQIIRDKIASAQQKVNGLLGDVRDVTSRLGIVPTEQSIEHQSGDNALAVISTQIDTTTYKRELISAKEKTLPDLFKAIEEANKELAGWMMAPTLPMQALINPMKDSIKSIEDRIHTVNS